MKKEFAGASAILVVLAAVVWAAVAEKAEGMFFTKREQIAAQPGTEAPATVENNDPAATEARLTALGKRDARIHDPSTVVKCKKEYWVFGTGPGVISYRSKDLLHWERGPRVFEEPPAWRNEVVPGHNGFFWAPDVIHLKDRYLLYYSVSAFGVNTSAIGLATNTTLDPADPKYKWEDRGIVVQTGRGDNSNAIDPAVIRDAEGKLWMAYGSFWSGIKLIQLDPATGRRIAPDSPVHALATNRTIEASAIFRHGGRYFLFVNWGLCCRGKDSTYEIRVGRSAKITGPYLDREGRDLLRGGGTLFLGTDGPFIGPGHAGILSERGTDWLSCHFYDGGSNGAPTLALRRLRFDREGWPTVANEKNEKSEKQERK